MSTFRFPACKDQYDRKDLPAVTLPRAQAVELFELAQDFVDRLGVTGLCYAVSAAARVLRGQRPNNRALRQLSENAYTYFAALPEYDLLAPHGDELPSPGSEHWFKCYIRDGRPFADGTRRSRYKTPEELQVDYEHRLTALAFLVTFAEEGAR